MKPVWRRGSTLVVLGGSSPFTVALVEALRNSEVPPGRLVLVGRRADALQALSAYAVAALEPADWTVRTARGTDPVSGDVFVHQIRYGGLARRQKGEHIATGAGVPADESMGAAGFYIALASIEETDQVAARVHESSPDAIVLNLTNPLGVMTDRFSRHGLRTIGLCELPLVTLSTLATSLGIAEDTIWWSLIGLTHRAFIHDVRSGGEDLLAKLPTAGKLGSIRNEAIHDMEAIPLKYHGLVDPSVDEGSWRSHEPGRARALEHLRERILAELRLDPTRFPSAALTRPSDWYAVTVVPALESLAGVRRSPTVVDVARATGQLVEEVRGRINSDGSVQALPASPAPAVVARWVSRFVAHEEAVLEALNSRSSAAIRAAVAADPSVPPDRVGATTEAILTALAGQDRYAS